MFSPFFVSYNRAFSYNLVQLNFNTSLMVYIYALDCSVSVDCSRDSTALMVGLRAAAAAWSVFVIFKRIRYPSK